MATSKILQIPLMGLEPTIFELEVQRLIHQATGAEWLQIIVREEICKHLLNSIFTNRLGKMHDHCWLLKQSNSVFVFSLSTNHHFVSKLKTKLQGGKKYGTLHEFACHPCAGAMLIFSVSFQFQYMYRRSEYADLSLNGVYMLELGHFPSSRLRTTSAHRSTREDARSRLLSNRQSPRRVQYVK